MATTLQINMNDKHKQEDLSIVPMACQETVWMVASHSSDAPAWPTRVMPLFRSMGDCLNSHTPQIASLMNTLQITMTMD